MSERYKAICANPFFLSPTVVGWVDIFTREKFCTIITDSLRFCFKNKSLIIYDYVIMPSHLHLIIQSEEGKLSSIIRDFKAHTAKQIIKCLSEEQGESRSEWILRWFKYNAKFEKQKTTYMVWQKTNKAIEIFSPKMMAQKRKYIYENPIKSGYVFQAEDWVYSSAHDESVLQDCLYGR